MIEPLLNEKIHFVRRRHWFKLFEAIIGISIGILAVVAVPVFLAAMYPAVFESFTNEIVLAAALMAQIFVVALFLILADYYLDIWIVTSDRLIFVELNGLFNRKMSSVYHSNIQDVSIEVRGIVPTILGYGDLHVQTAGEFHQFVFKDVPEPYKLKDKILSLHGQNQGTEEN